jgi:sugar phosphate isomerase/epimerase
MTAATVPLAPGLCSITLRGLDADAVLAAAVVAGVEGIEWGADVHVPVGDESAAARVALRCGDDGVEVVSYGTYLGASAETDQDLDALIRATLDTACALGAPMVRVWTELGVLPDAPAEDRARVVDRTCRILEAATARGLVVAIEFHPFTHTHTAVGALALLAAVDDRALRTHWQPDPALSDTDALAELDAIADHLAHLHLFCWGPGGIDERRPLSAGAGLWPAALRRARTAPLPPGVTRRFALCEHVADDSADQLTADVATLRRWIAALR